MNKTLIGSLILAAMLAGCSSKAVKPEPAPPVEDKSPTSSVPAKPAAPAEATKPDAETSTLKQDQGSQGSALSPLKDPNNILSKRSVYFDFDRDEVKAEYRPLVEAHAAYLKQNPDARVMLQGNADDRGSREYNLALGQRRSVAVKTMLNTLGATDKQIETVSYGEEKPRCSDSSEACRAENRRADIIYAGEE